MSENVLVLGATSGIGQPVCHKLAARGCALVLAGRRENELQRMADDLKVRYQAAASVATFDAMALDTHKAFIDSAIAQADHQLDGVLLCQGYLPDQQEAQADFAEAKRTIDVNYTSAVSLLEPVAAHMAERRAGWIAVIGSVAGDRGRMSNYLYGSAKAGLSAYLQGLRNRLAHAGVHVLTIKPGPVDTPMTEGVVDTNKPTVATAEQVAADIDKAIRKRKNVLYTPWFWRPIMAVIRTIPEFVFKKMKM